MKTIIALMFMTTYAYGANCSKHPIYCQIKKNSPKINKKYAMKLSNIVYKMHRKYHIPSRIFTAILRQESNYSLKAKGCHRGMRELSDIERQFKVRECREKAIENKSFGYSKCIIDMREQLVESKICSDFGTSQIYYRTARSYKLNLSKLTKDLDYSVEAGAKVLAGFMERYEAKDTDWWVRYNCGNKGTTKRDTCQIYKKLVERYL